VTSGASAEIERVPGSQTGAGFDEKRVGFDELRFSGEEFCVPAIAVGRLILRVVGRVGHDALVILE
jgi:hypothetical protein